jgi:hypothetical protein
MFERAEKWSIHSGAGHWPDADMLPIGPIFQTVDKSIRSKFTHDELITMMTLWSIFRSPLMIGGEMTGFDDFDMSLLTNERLLAMHKNSRHSHQVWRREINGAEHILWTSVSSDGGQYIAVFNVSDSSSNIEISLSDVEIYENVSATEIWSGEKTDVSEKINVSLNSHGAKAFYLE